MTEPDIHLVLELLNQPFVLGEYTTDAGPYDDDHFIVIAGLPDYLVELPVSTEKSEHILQSVRDQFGKDIQLSLSNSTKFRSRILHPENLAEAEFFSYVESKSARRTNFLRRLSPTKENYVVSSAVKEYLQFMDAQTRES